MVKNQCINCTLHDAEKSWLLISFFKWIFFAPVTNLYPFFFSVNVNALQCSQFFALLLSGYFSPLSQFYALCYFAASCFPLPARLFSFDRYSKYQDNTVSGAWCLQWMGCLGWARLWMNKWMNKWMNL